MWLPAAGSGLGSVGVCHTPFVLVQRPGAHRPVGVSRGGENAPLQLNTDSANPLQTHFQALCPRGPGPFSPLRAVSSSLSQTWAQVAAAQEGACSVCWGGGRGALSSAVRPAPCGCPCGRACEVLGGWGWGGRIPLLCQARRPPGGAGTSPPRPREGRAPRHQDVLAAVPSSRGL